jgi:adenosylcobyric acid synthase
MLGRTIIDPVEAARDAEGLGWLPADTIFEADKVTRQRRGHVGGQRLTGYQIHHGRTAAAEGWITLDDLYGRGADGATARDGSIKGTSLHGVFEEDGFRGAFLAEVAARRAKTRAPSNLNFQNAREAQIDRLADLIEGHIDLARIEAMLR